MREKYSDYLTWSMHVSNFLHYLGIHAKLAGNIGVLGEIDGIIPIIHSPQGCAYHYVFSPRKKNKPLYDTFCTGMTESDIVYGGAVKLRNTIIEVYENYSPKLIVVLPSPVSDLMNEDIEMEVLSIREELNINVIALKSEVFSHRDRSSARNALKQTAKKPATDIKPAYNNIKGCGYIEAMIALVDNVMEKQTIIENTVNIETFGMGFASRISLIKIEELLNKIGIKVNTLLPSCSYESIVTAPQAKLNISTKKKWAFRMNEKFGTDYFFIENTYQYVGKDGIKRFYLDIAKYFDLEEKATKVLNEDYERYKDKIELYKDRISQHTYVIYSENINLLPAMIKAYQNAYGMNIKYICIKTDKLLEDFKISEDVFGKLINRIKLTMPEDCKLIVDPNEKEKKKVFLDIDYIVGRKDVRLEQYGTCVLNPIHEQNFLYYEGYTEVLKNIINLIEKNSVKSKLLLNNIDYDDKINNLLKNSNHVEMNTFWRRTWD